MQGHIDKINEMASVMRKAIEVDEERTCEDEERIKQLEVRAALRHKHVQMVLSFIKIHVVELHVCYQVETASS